MLRPTRPRRHALRASIALGALTLAPLVAACSSSNDATPPSTAVPGTSGTAPGTTTALSDEERLAEAKTVAVGFFQAQAVNDYAKARERSSGAAALTIDWAEAVNGIAAATDSGYQVPAVASPNVRVQIDALEDDGPDRWTATGFVELSFRPGPVATTTTAPAGGSATTAPASPSTYAVDLTFVGGGDTLRLDDYRLDDLPYPVSQLFMAIDSPSSEADGVKGTTTLGHRDLDGSVQYVVQVEASEAVDPSTWVSTFTPAPNASAPGTSILPLGPTSVDGTTFADPLRSGTPASVLVVFPGAFPGGPGTLALSTTAGPASTTTTSGTAGTSSTGLAWALPDFPTLTPRPVNTVDVTTSTSTSSTTSTSTTSTTSPSSTTVPTTAVPATSTTRPATTSSSAPSSTSTSTTTSTVAP